MSKQSTFGLSVLVILTWITSAARGQFDETCTVTVNGRSAIVNPDGSFRISNLPANGGLVQVRAFCSRPDITFYGQTEFFEVPDAGTFTVQDLSLDAFPLPNLVRLTRGTNTADVDFNALGQQAQLQIVGEFSDSSGPQDLTMRQDGSSYTSSNPQIASVDENGVVTANGTGVAFITITNRGAVTGARVIVAPDNLRTTVSGIVFFEDSTPAAGANVRIIGLNGFEDSTDDMGVFEIQDVPIVGSPTVAVRAEILVNEVPFLGSNAMVDVMPEGISDAGIITLRERAAGLGPIIISGHDPEDHGYPNGPGGEMVEDMLRFVGDNSGLIAAPGCPDGPHVLMLGGTVGGTAVNGARTIVTSMDRLGYNFTHVTGDAIDAVDLDPATTCYTVIFMPTTQGEVSSGLSGPDLARVNERADDILDFVNAGGGLVAFAQNRSGGFEWFPLGGLQTRNPISSSNSFITPEGTLILRQSAINVTPFHQAFTGPAGFFGLDVLVREGAGEQAPLILGGFADIQP